VRLALGIAAVLAVGTLVSLPGEGATVEVSVKPTADARGMPWRLQVLEAREAGDFLVFEEPVPARGPTRFEQAKPGTSYKLRLKASTDDFWLTDEKPFVATEETHRRKLEVGIEPFKGWVAVGRRRVPARVVFVDAKLGARISVMANAKGDLAGALPRLGTWQIEVSNEAPHLVRTVEETLSRSRREEAGILEIVLEDRTVGGRFVDEDGALVKKRVFLYIRRVGGRSPEYREIEDGVFTLSDLEPGQYVLTASGPHLRADPVEVEVPEEGSPDPLDIVLKHTARIHGIVLSDSGKGVQDAQVVSLAPVPTLSGPEGAELSDFEGRFEMEVRSTLKQVCVAVFAPMMEKRMLVLRVAPDEQEVPVARIGGTLTLRYEPPEDGRIPMIFHGDCVAYPTDMRGRRRKTAEGATAVTLPLMEPGTYTFCVAPHGALATYAGGVPRIKGCVTGELPQNGALDLTAE
jgi:hypothetical protein